MYKLPVWQTIKDAYGFTFSQWRAVLKYASPLIIVCVVGIVGVADLFARPGQFSGLTAIAAVVIYLVGVALAVGFAIAMHRHYLIGPDSRGFLVTLSWGSRQWRFLGWAIAVGIGAGLLSILFSLPAFLLIVPGQNQFFDPFTSGASLWTVQLIWALFGVGVWFVVILIMAGALIRFPLYAIDATQETIDRVADLVRNNRRRVGLIFLLGDAIPFMAFDLILTWTAIEAGAIEFSPDTAAQARMETVSLVTTSLQLASGLFWLAVTAVMLSMIYKQLSENVTLPEKPSVPPPPPNADE